jgi:hypothetical protein
LARSRGETQRVASRRQTPSTMTSSRWPSTGMKLGTTWIGDAWTTDASIRDGVRSTA